MAKRCAICQNAYDTRYICKACKVDPANDTWTETSGGTSGTGGQGREVAVAEYRDTDRPAVFDGAARPVQYTTAERFVALGIWFGHTDAEIARTTGLSRAHVGRIRTKFLGEEMKSLPDFSWMSDESKDIIRCISDGLDDATIVIETGADADHILRIRTLMEKAGRRIPYTEHAE